MKLALRLHERWAIPGGNVLGGRKLGAAAPLFPRGCDELSGECERGTHECVRHGGIDKGSTGLIDRDSAGLIGEYLAELELLADMLCDCVPHFGSAGRTFQIRGDFAGI